MLEFLAAARTKRVGIALTAIGVAVFGVAAPNDPLLGDPAGWVIPVMVIGVVLAVTGFVLVVISVAGSAIIAISRWRRGRVAR